MKTRIYLFLIAIVIISGSCSYTRNNSKVSKVKLLNGKLLYQLEISNDETYGYIETNPIKVGGVSKFEGPKNERSFLSALSGPNKEPISYKRLGSCCKFETKNGINGYGLLDKYEIKWRGQANPVILYFNMYDNGELKVPVGFTINQE